MKVYSLYKIEYWDEYYTPEPDAFGCCLFADKEKAICKMQQWVKEFLDEHAEEEFVYIEDKENNVFYAHTDDNKKYYKLTILEKEVIEK